MAFGSLRESSRPRAMRLSLCAGRLPHRRWYSDTGICNVLGCIAVLAVVAPCIPCGTAWTSSPLRRSLSAGVLGQLAGYALATDGMCTESVSNDPTEAESTEDWGSSESYPGWLLGDWDATSQLFAVEAPQGASLAGEAALRARGDLGTAAATERYQLRFFDRDTRIISDLACNTRPILRGLGGVGAAESSSWQPVGADVERFELRVKRQDGFVVRVQMRRAVNELFPNERLVSGGRVFLSNEFFYAETEAPVETTPVRCVSKFRRLQGGPDVQVLQRVEVYPSVGVVAELPGTGSAIVLGDSGGDLSLPIAKYKNRVHLRRAGSPAFALSPCDEAPPCGYPFNARSI